MKRNVKAVRSVFIPNPGISLLTACAVAAILGRSSMMYWGKESGQLTTDIYLVMTLILAPILLLLGSALINFYRILDKQEKIDRAKNMRVDLLAERQGAGPGTTEEISDLLISLDLEIARLEAEIAALQ